VIWPEVTYVRDSLSAMALTLALMARTGKSVSELVAMVDAMGPGKKGYCILKRKAPLASKADAVPVVKHVAGHYKGVAGAVVDTQDGVRIDWPERGVWAHVRASNTEPIMRVIVEAPTEGEAGAVASEVEGVIAGVRT
jgi:phosphomannomutase